MDDVDAEVEVLAETALLDERRSRSRLVAATIADVEGHLGVAADGPDRPLLERAQELRLQRERHLADLVEEERAAVRLDEEAGARRRARR